MGLKNKAVKGHSCFYISNEYVNRIRYCCYMGGFWIMNTKCPHCNYLATEHETLNEESNPKIGDISFCLNCGEVNEFTKKGLVKTNIDSLDQKTKAEIKKVESAWLQTRNFKEAGK